MSALARIVVMEATIGYGPMNKIAPDVAVQSVGPDGTPTATQPDVNALAFTTPDGSMQVVIALNDVGKAGVMKLLTGGVIVASSLDGIPK